MFGRRKKGAADEVDELDAEQAETEVEDLTPAPPRPSGPWDDADAPEDDINRIDLGGLLIPVPADTEVRVDVSPEGEVVAATLVIADSSMQVNAFAAPRSYGIWAEVREEIAVALRETGGQAEDAEGPYGTELQAQVPIESGGFTPARFLGVDGPRWFLRALLTGPAATDPAAAAALEAALKDVVVLRGTDPMAVRDPLPLALPKQVAEAAAESAAATDEESLQMPERGPEITELR